MMLHNTLLADFDGDQGVEDDQFKKTLTMSVMVMMIVMMVPTT